MTTFTAANAICKSCIFYSDGSCLLAKMFFNILNAHTQTRAAPHTLPSTPFHSSNTLPPTKQPTRDFFCNMKWYFPLHEKRD